MTTTNDSRSPEEMSREDLIEEIMWSEGGAGWGVCSFGNMMMAKMTAVEIPSIVTLQGEQDCYTADELRKVVGFSRKRSERHRMICGNIRSSDNLFILKKYDDGSWLSKKRSWEYGRMASKTLDDAIEFLSR